VTMPSSQAPAIRTRDVSARRQAGTLPGLSPSENTVGGVDTFLS